MDIGQNPNRPKLVSFWQTQHKSDKMSLFVAAQAGWFAVVNLNSLTRGVQGTSWYWPSSILLASAAICVLTWTRILKDSACYNILQVTWQPRICLCSGVKSRTPKTPYI
jgi:hypothetical protein